MDVQHRALGLRSGAPAYQGGNHRSVGIRRKGYFDSFVTVAQYVGLPVELHPRGSLQRQRCYFCRFGGVTKVSPLPMLRGKGSVAQVERSQSLIPPRIPASLSTKVTSGPRSNSILVELPPPM